MIKKLVESTEDKNIDLFVSYDIMCILKSHLEVDTLYITRTGTVDNTLYITGTVDNEIILWGLTYTFLFP